MTDTHNIKAYPSASDRILADQRSAASERDRALRDRAIANTFEGRNVMEPRADAPIPDAATAFPFRFAGRFKKTADGRVLCATCGCVAVTTTAGRWICGGWCPN